LQRPVHRAESDAIAALEVFKYLQHSDTADVIGTFLTRRTAEFTYPPNLPVTALNDLPMLPAFIISAMQGEKCCTWEKQKA
jgi:hypothetical protein